MKITKSQLRKLIKEMAFTSSVSDYMSDMGDTKMTPEAHLFFFRGVPSHSMKLAIEGILGELEEGGIKLPAEKETLANKIINEIHKIVKENL